MGTNRVCGGAKPSERSEEHDLIEILIRVLLDEMETIFPIIADQFIGTVQTDRSASNDGIGLPDPRQSLVHEELVDAGILAALYPENRVMTPSSPKSSSKEDRLKITYGFDVTSPTAAL